MHFERFPSSLLGVLGGLGVLCDVFFLALLIMATFVTTGCRANDPTFLRGADISMLPELERAGAVYRANGSEGDAIEILRNHGVNAFRVRLFVNPSTDFNKNWGATQNLDPMIALAKRIKHSNAKLILDLHYSDTWADPKQQTKPAAWAALSFDQLEEQLHRYTAETLAQFAAAGAAPDFVQIGNEIAGGFLWPDAKLVRDDHPDADQQWSRFARLLNAGARAARAFDPKIKIILHIHGGGREDLPRWFFTKLESQKVDYDIAAVSFYPTYADSLPMLRDNLAELAITIDKPLLIAETSYPWKPINESKPTMTWPTTPAGQHAFLRDLLAIAREVPNNRCIGIIWWYPEARPTGSLHIYRDGADALFDNSGNALPALLEFQE